MVLACRHTPFSQHRASCSRARAHSHAICSGIGFAVNPSVASTASYTAQFINRRSSRRACAVKTAGAQAVALPDLLDIAKQAAAAGAQVVTDALDKPRAISFKGATDLVTETDKTSEEAVLKLIRQHFPDHAVLGEEGGVSGNAASDYLWVLDPIDGTSNFAHNYPAFAVSVGLLQRGKPVVGCVVEFTGGPHAWTTRTFAAHSGGGATCNGKPIHVSNISSVQRSLLVTGFGYDHDDAWLANMALFQELTDVSQGVRRLGAAAVDLCHVSLGIVEAYWEYRLKPWDVTAGVVVLQEAGGKITTMDGRPYSVFERSLLATNGSIHEPLLAFTEPRTRKLVESGVDLSPWFKPEGYMVDV